MWSSRIIGEEINGISYMRPLRGRLRLRATEVTEADFSLRSK